MLGMFQIMYGPENDVCEKYGVPKITELMPMYSRDGYHFSRPSREAFITASMMKGTWDRGYVQSVGGGVIIDQAIHSIDLVNWLVDSEVEIAVQFNGKLKGTIVIPVNATQDEVFAIMDKDEKIKNNRLALLNELKNKYIILTDFSKLSA